MRGNQLRDARIWAARKSGRSVYNLAMEYGLTGNRIRQICHREEQSEERERRSFYDNKFTTPLATAIYLVPVVRWFLYHGGLEAFKEFCADREDPNEIESWIFGASL